MNKNLYLTVCFLLIMHSLNSAAKPELVFVEGGNITINNKTIAIGNFEITKFEITNSEYADFLNAEKVGKDGVLNNRLIINISSPDLQLEYKNNKWVTIQGKEKRPMVMVNYFGATEYCNWIGGRLPDVPEWTWAAKGGIKSKDYTYAGSNKLEEVGWFRGNCEGRSHDAGELKANELGIFDMSGNAWEWVLNDSLKNDKDFALHMGGSWFPGEAENRINARFGNTPDHFSNSVGFRVIFPVKQKISPYLFGQNHWLDRSDEGNRPGYIYKLWPKIKESGIKTVRIGGGGYDRRLPNRPALTAIVDSIQSIGAEPILQVPSHYSAEEAAELVKYFNKNPSRKPIKFWSIGNEPLLRVRDNRELMMKTLEETVYKFLILLAPAMKAADPSIKILVFDCEGLPVDNTEKFNYEAIEAICGGRLDITGKDKNGNWLVDGINFHSYPNNKNYTRDHVIFTSTYMIRQSTNQLLGLIEKANRKNGRTGESRLMWGLTEINVTAGNPDREVTGIGCPSFLGGQFIAEMYGIGMKNGAFTVSPWCISETDRVRTDFGYIGLPTDFYPRSSYYHTQMMALNMRGEFLQTESNNSYVKTIGSNSNSEICVMILNSDQVHDFNFDLILNKKGDSPKQLKINADLGLNKIISGTIPNQTTILLVLSKTGELIRQYTYSLNHNLKNLPPEVKTI